MHRTALAAFLALSTLAPGAAAGELPREKDTWVRVRTPHFTLVGNAPAWQVEALARKAEGLRRTLETVSVNMETRSPVPTRIYVFKHDRSFRPYKLGEDDRPENMVGYFVGTSDGNFMAMDGSVQEEAERILFHEYVHYWLHANIPNIPLWLDEGLAEYFSTFEIRKDGAEIGRPLGRHVRWLGGHTLIPLGDLFALDHDSPDYHEGERQGTIYAQAWALVHYLMSSEEGRKKVAVYLSRLRAGEPEQAAREAALGADLAALGTAAREYARKQSFVYYKVPAEESLSSGGVEAEPLAYADVLFYLGDLLAHRKPVRFADAERHLKAAIERKPDHAEAHAVLGLLRSMQGDFQGAEAFLARAVELDPDHARVRWLYGHVLLDRFDRTEREHIAELQETTPPLLARAREQFRKALELDPDHAPSLAGLGETYLLDLDPSEGVGILARAVEAYPARTDLLVDLIAVTANAGNTAGARALLEKALRPRGDEEQILAAEEVVVQAERNEAVALFNAGRRQEALERMQEILEQTTSPGLRRGIRRAMAEMGAVAAGNEQVERYNEAVRLARENRFDEAVAILEALKASSSDAQIRGMASDLLEEIQEVRRRNEHVRRFNEAVRVANEQRFDDAVALLEALLADEPDEDLRRSAENLLAEIRKFRGRP